MKQPKEDPLPSSHQARQPEPHENMLSFDTRSFNDLLAQLHDCQLISDLKRLDPQGSPLKDWGVKFLFEGRVKVAEYPAILQIGLHARFPSTLPIIYVTADELGLMPHVLGGLVCYAPSEGLLVNRHDPVGVVQEALRRAINTLEKGILGENQQDFVNEFNAYWRQLKDGVQIQSFVNPDSLVVHKIKAGKSVKEREEAFSFLTDELRTVQGFYGNKSKGYTYQTALHIPLEEGTLILPPRVGEFWTTDQVRAIVYAALSPKNARILKKLTRKKPKREEVVMFKLPRTDGGSSLFGIYYKGVASAHPLHQEGYAAHLIPLVIERCDKQYLLPRGGANISMQKKRVVLLGCGAVGGFLALELIRTGLRDLTLVDHEKLTLDNVYRHELGKDMVGTYKVLALKQEIERKVPYTNIIPIPDHAETAIEGGRLKPDRFDLIIIAIGDETVCLYLNELIRSKKPYPPIIFSWLEPYGIGGHTLLTGNASAQGCYECLVTPVTEDEGQALYNRASFAASGQFFAKDISGCGSLFTPYGSTDALQTALLTTRLAVDVLLGNEPGNPLISWKGSATQFLGAGHILSSRYELTEDEMFARRYDYINSRCPVCALN